MSDLNDTILAAHAADDGSALVALYTQAADQAPDLDTACFFLTYAYIYALELGMPQEVALHARLAAHGRV